MFEVKTGSIARLLTLLRESLRTAMKRKRLQSQRTPPLEKTRARLSKNKAATHDLSSDDDSLG